MPRLVWLGTLLIELAVSFARAEKPAPCAGRPGPLGDRRVVADLSQGVYPYVGVVWYELDEKRVNKPGSSSYDSDLVGSKVAIAGTGTLISPRHVLTAAHVIHLEGKGRDVNTAYPEPVFFELPSGERRKVVGMLLDPNFADLHDGVKRTLKDVRELRRRALDLSILTLERNLLIEGGAARIRSVENDLSFWNAILHTGVNTVISGFDGDVNCTAGVNVRGLRGVALLDRDAVMSYENTLAALTGGVAGGAGLALPRLLLGPGQGGVRSWNRALSAATLAFLGAEFGKRIAPVWTAKDVETFGGASGAPLWIREPDGRPAVVGVLSGGDEYGATGPFLDDFYMDFITEYTGALPK